MMRGGGFTSMRGSSAMLDVEVTSSGTTIFTDINRPSGV